MNTHKKVRNAAVGIILSVGVVLSAFLTTFQVRALGAEPDFSQFVTSYAFAVKDSHDTTLQDVYLDKDSGSGTLPTVQIGDGMTVKLGLKFALTDIDPVSDSGDHVKNKEYTLQLPAALSAQSAGPTAIKIIDPNSGDTVTVGSWSISSSGTLTVNFNDLADNYDSREGYFNITTSFSASGLGSDSGGVIPFQIGASTVDLPVQVTAPAVGPTIQKTGNYNNGTITWTVTVASGNDGFNGGLTGVTVTDTLSGNQTIQTSPAPTWGGIEVKDSSVTTTEVPWYEGTGPDTVVFHLGDMKHNTTSTLVYTTKANDPDEKPVFPNSAVKYTNTAVLGANEITSGNPPTVTKSVDGNTIPSWITKTNMTGTSVRTSSIDWKITVNPYGGTIEAGTSEATVTDTLPNKYLSLSSGVYLNGSATPLDSDSTKDVYYTTSQDAGGVWTITVHFQHADITTEQDLTFTTAVDPAYYQTNQSAFTNTATLSQGGNSQSAGATGVGSSVISKAGTSYDAATHLATWTITVNSNKIAMTDPVVTDQIDWNGGASKGAHQIFHSISAAKADKTLVSLTQVYSTSGMSGNEYFVSPDQKTVTVHLADFNDGDQPVVLTVVTEVTDPHYYGINGSNTVYNSASLTASSGTITGGQDAQQTITSQVIDKTGTYDYSGKTLSWNITVNQNKMQMKNTVVTDTLPSDLVFSGVTVDGTAIQEGSASGTQYYTLSGQTLTVYLGDISAQAVIEVTETMPDSVLAGHNADFYEYNTAEIKFDDISGFTTYPSAAANPKIDQSVVEKSGSYDATARKLNWTVLINKNQVPANVLGIPSGTTSVTLNDKLQDGLVLDPDSVSLYKLSWGANGSWTKGSQIPLTVSDAVSYNPGINQFTFTFPSGTDFSKAYELDFSTDVTKYDDYVNTITMEGMASNQGGTASAVLVGENDFDFGYTGLPRGDATVTKVDQDTRAAIPGTTFTLYQNGIPIQSGVTDAQGHLKFSNLKQGKTYTIRETAPAAGYQSNSTQWDFTPDASSLHLAKTFEDLAVGASSSQASSQPAGSSEASSTAPVSPTPASSSPSSVVPSQPGGNHGGGGGGGTTPVSSSTASSSSAPQSSSAASSGSTVSSTLSSASSIASSTPGGVTGTVLTGPAALYIKKADKNGRALSGAEFTLFDADGKALQKKVTGSSGVIVFRDLAAGSYVVRETKAPAHYKLYSGELDVTLLSGQQSGYTLRDSLEGDDTGTLGWTSDGSLPKTGEFPIAPLVAVCGLLLILTGVAVRRAGVRKKRMKHFHN